jgi:predicted nucleic acid-binding protein
MEFDLDRTLRRVKPERHAAQLDRRPDAELTFVDDEPLVGAPLLLDTCVYLHVLRGRTPSRVDDLLRTRTLHHSATALAELTNRFGSRLPANTRERKARETLALVIREIPPHRMINPTVAMWGEAGIIAGLHARVGGFAQAGGHDTLNDALILLQAIGIGAAVLTANISDFDILQQLAPTGRVLFYKEIS